MVGCVSDMTGRAVSCSEMAFLPFMAFSFVQDKSFLSQQVSESAVTANEVMHVPQTRCQ